MNERNLAKSTTPKPYIPTGDVISGMIIPNHSGDHSAGTVIKEPVNDYDIANKAYVDNMAGANVTSVFSRVGDVVAETNDYTWAQIDKTTSDIADINTRSHTSLTDIGTNTHAQIDTGLSDAAAHAAASAPHSGHVDTTGNETIAGVKTFSSFPVTPSSSPTTDYQVTNKKYVDDLIALSISWKEPVKDVDSDTPPGSPSQHDRYIVDTKGEDSIIGIVDSPLSGNDYFILNGDQSADYAAGDVVLIKDSTANDGYWNVSEDAYLNTGSDLITALDQGTRWFETDDLDDFKHFQVGDSFSISGSTGNDGAYTVASLANDSGFCKIYVNESIPDPTPDGQIDWTYNKTNVYVNESITDTTVDGALHFAGGAWSSKGVGKIVEYNGASWDAETPSDGWAVIATDDAKGWVYYEDELEWINLSQNTAYTGSLGVQIVGTDIRSDLKTSGGLVLDSNDLMVSTDGSSIEIGSTTGKLQVKALGVTNAMLSGSIEDSKLNQISTAAKISGSAISGLAYTPNSAGYLPTANLGSGTATASTYLRGDQTWASSGSESETLVVLTTDRSTTSTSFSDCTGLSFAMGNIAGDQYLVEAYIYYTTAATTTGINLACNGPSGVSFIVGQTQSMTTTTAMQARGFSAYNVSGGTLTAARSGNNLAKMNIVVKNGSSAGNFIIRFATEVSGSTVTIKTGSFIRYRPIV